jgi:leucyl-tRNA synthetase
LAAFIDECRKTGTAAAEIETQEKLGFDTGISVIHPFTGAKLPVFVANFVLMEYGTGAVMAVPAHDQRDLDFARKYSSPPRVVSPDGKDVPVLRATRPMSGRAPSSTRISSMAWRSRPPRPPSSPAPRRRLGQGHDHLAAARLGRLAPALLGYTDPVHPLRCCGVVPVPKGQLPVVLPDDVSFDIPGNPLERHPTWKHVDCPGCGKPARRETDTLDTFVDSSWYFIRFASQPDDKPFDRPWRRAGCRSGQYIGGIEHAILHLLYARFWTRALNYAARSTSRNRSPACSRRAW